MTSESVVCLDRRVVSPAASEAGGSTTWTLPYPVAVDGSQGRVAVVRLDTAVELTVTRPSTTTVRAVGSFSAFPVAVGIAYNWRYVPSTIYMKNADGKPDRRAPVRLSYVKAHLSGTREVDATIAVPDRADVALQFRQAVPKEGQAFTLPVFTDSVAAGLELHSETPWPVRVGTLGWEGQFSPSAITNVP